MEQSLNCEPQIKLSPSVASVTFILFCLLFVFHNNKKLIQWYLGFIPVCVRVYVKVFFFLIDI